MPMPVIDHTGQRFGKLAIVRRASSRSGQATWLCRCDCGIEKEIAGSYLRRSREHIHPEYASCGCQTNVARDLARSTHGYSSHYIYPTWADIRARCHNLDRRGFDNYGGRGIELFEPWRNDPRPFFAWIDANLGPRPKGFSLDRINVNGHYEPGNLRWADAKTQLANQRRYQVTEDERRILALFQTPLAFTFHTEVKGENDELLALQIIRGLSRDETHVEVARRPC